ncbi:hypothetical protein MRX96_040665 [Rhipicephalus microplus]
MGGQPASRAPWRCGEGFRSQSGRDDRSTPLCRPTRCVALRESENKKQKALLHFPAEADKHAGESGSTYVTSPRLLPVERHWCVEFGATNGKAIESPALPCRAAKRKEKNECRLDFTPATESERARMSMYVCPGAGCIKKYEQPPTASYSSLFPLCGRASLQASTGKVPATENSPNVRLGQRGT